MMPLVSNLAMDSFGEEPSQITSKLAMVAIFASAGASIAYMFLKTPVGLDGTREHWATSAAVASTLVFLCASILVIYKPRFGYGLGLAAGLIALSWCIRTELMLAPEVNSWIELNIAEAGFPGEGAIITFAKLKILSIALITIAIVCSALRLLPARLLLRRRPLCQRTWPAFAVSFLVVVVWFVHSAMPYRVPMFVREIPPEFRIVHVEKHGLRFHETEVDTFRDGQVYIVRSDRRLFQYRFDTRIARSILSPSLNERARAFGRSPELLKLQTAPAKALRSWNAEGWYVVLDNLRPSAFTAEYQMAPPRQVTDLFYQIEKLPATEQRAQGIRDICMGFCYQPAALQVH